MPTFDAGTIQADIEINRDKLKSSVQDAVGELDRLATEGGQAGEQAGKKTGNAMGDALNFSLEGALDQAKDKVKSKLSDMAEGGAGAGKLVGAGVGLALVAGLAAAINMEGPRAKLTAQLDLTTTESARLGGVAGKLFAANYGAGLEDVTGAIRLVVQNIDGMRDASAEDLQSITGQVMSLASAFDQDLGATTRAVGQMMRTGMAKDAQEALDIIAKGFTSGADKSEDFLDTLNEYGTQFRKLGIDGKDATGLISQGLKAGARDADIVADAFKEFSIRAVDGSKLTATSLAALGISADDLSARVSQGGAVARAATDQVMDALRAIPEGAGKAAIAVGLFGTQSEDLGRALNALDLSTAADQLGDVEGAAGRVDAAMGSTAAGGITSLGRGLMVLADQLGQALLPVIRPVITGLAMLLAGAGDLLGMVMDLPGPLWVMIGAIGAVMVAGTVATTVQAFAGSLVAAGIAVRTFMASLGPIGILLAGVTTAMAFFMDSTDETAQVTQEAGDRWERLKGTLDAVTGAVTDATRAQIAQEAQQSGMLSTLEAAGVSTKLYVDATAGIPGAQEALAESVEGATARVLGQNDAFAAAADVLRGAGVSQMEFARAVASGDLTEITAKVNAYAEAQAKSTGDVNEAARIQALFRAAVEGSPEALTQLTGVLNLTESDAQKFATAAAAAAEQSRALGTDAAGAAGGVAEIGGAAAVAVDPMEALGTATDDMGAAADAATTATQFLSAALDEAQGYALSAEQAQRLNEAAYRDTEKSARELADAQGALEAAQVKVIELNDAGVTSGAEYDAAQKALVDSTADLADKSDGLFDSQMKVRDSALAAAGAAAANDLATGNLAGAAAAANAVMEVQRTRFMASASAADITSGAAQRTADKLFGIPGEVGTLITEKGAAAVQGAAAGVTGAVDAIPKNPTVTVGVVDNASSAIGRIRAAYDALQDKTVTVTGRVVGAGLAGLVDFADGGILAMANGGQLAADGLTLAAGRGISQVRQGKGDGVTWAEGITNEEIYISMKSGMEARNRMFTDYAAGKLGGRVQWDGQRSQAPAAARTTEKRWTVGSVSIGRFDDADRFFDRAAWEVLG